MTSAKFNRFHFIIWIVVLFLAFTGISIRLFGISLMLYRLVLPVYLICCAINWKRLKNQAQRLNKSPFTKIFSLFMLFWVFWSVISLLWVKDLSSAVRNVYFLVLSVILILSMQLMGSEGSKNRFYLNLLTFCSLIFFGFGFYQLFTGFQLPNSIFYNSDRVDLLHRATSFFVNTNDFGTFISMYIWLLYIQMECTSHKLLKALSLVIFAAVSILLIVTTSRAGILTFVLQMIMLLLFDLSRISIRKISSVTRPVLTVFLILLFVFINTSTEYGRYNHKIYKFDIKAATAQLVSNFKKEESRPDETAVAVQPTPTPGVVRPTPNAGKQLEDVVKEGQIEGTSANVRINIIKNSMLIIKDTYLMGTGAGNFEHYMREYGGKQHKTERINPHNWWLEILVNYGVIIFISYITLYAALLVKLLLIYIKSVRKRDKASAAMAKAFLIILGGFILSSISPSSIMGFRTVWLMFGFILGFIFNFDAGSSETAV